MKLVVLFSSGNYEYGCVMTEWIEVHQPFPKRLINSLIPNEELSLSVVKTVLVEEFYRL